MFLIEIKAGPGVLHCMVSAGPAWANDLFSLNLYRPVISCA